MKNLYVYPSNAYWTPACFRRITLVECGGELSDKKFYQHGSYRIKFIMRNGYVKIFV